jgi:hypothetical protein
MPQPFYSNAKPLAELAASRKDVAFAGKVQARKNEAAPQYLTKGDKDLSFCLYSIFGARH